MFRRSLPLSPRVIGLLVLAVFGLAGFVGFNAINGIPGYPYNYVDVTYATASNLTIHDEVREHSQRIGQVSAITYDNGAARVRMQLDPGTEVYSDATASIGDVSSLGQEFVELDPGTKASGPISSRGIPANRTTTPVEIDTVLSILNPKVSGDLAATVQTLGGGVGTDGQNINDLISRSTTLLPNVGTVNSTLADPATNLSGLIGASNLLASRFDGRTAQLQALLGQFTTTLDAIDTNSTAPLQATIADTAPAVTAAVPALQSLTTAEIATGNALAALQPGFSAAAANTTNLRAEFRDALPPLSLTPAVSGQAAPALGDLAGTAKQIESPTVPFFSQLVQASNPLLTYLAPYSGDTYALFDHLQSALSQGNGDGTWLRIGVYEGAEAAGGANASGTQCRDAYPAPGKSYGDGARYTGACP